MANFSEETVGDFGVPGVEIESTNSSIYDPYRGLDLLQLSSFDIYYWQLLYKLFSHYCGTLPDFPCEGPANPDDSAPYVTVDQCTSFFEQEYQLPELTANNLCEGFDKWDEDGGFNGGTANDKIEMGRGWVTHTAWELALRAAGWCESAYNSPYSAFDSLSNAELSQHRDNCRIPYDINQDDGGWGTVEILTLDGTGTVIVPDGFSTWYSVTNPPKPEYSELYQIPDYYVGACLSEDQGGLGENRPWYCNWFQLLTWYENINWPLWNNGSFPPRAMDGSNSVTIDVEGIYYNTKKYYLLDQDIRPSLGLYSIIDDNISKDNFTINLSDKKFEQIPKINLINNYDGRFVEENDYYLDSLGTGTYKPSGNWDYIIMDGVGLNVAWGDQSDGESAGEILDLSGFPTTLADSGINLIDENDDQDGQINTYGLYNSTNVKLLFSYPDANPDYYYTNFTDNSDFYIGGALSSQFGTAGSLIGYYFIVDSEKILITNHIIEGENNRVILQVQRGYDNTQRVGHSPGAPVNLIQSGEQTEQPGFPTTLENSLINTLEPGNAMMAGGGDFVYGLYNTDNDILMFGYPDPYDDGHSYKNFVSEPDFYDGYLSSQFATADGLVGYYFLVGSEKILITGQRVEEQNDRVFLDLQRGYDGTQIVGHNPGESVNLYQPDARRVIRDFDFDSYKQRFIQNDFFDGNYDNPFGYAGYYPYVKPGYENLSADDYEWARWIKSTECYSWDKCLEFKATNSWNDTTMFSMGDYDEYGTHLEHRIRTYSDVNGNFTYNEEVVQSGTWDVSSLLANTPPDLNVTEITVTNIELWGDFGWTADEHLAYCTIGGVSFGELDSDSSYGDGWESAWGGGVGNTLVAVDQNHQVAYDWRPMDNVSPDPAANVSDDAVAAGIDVPAMRVTFKYVDEVSQSAIYSNFILSLANNNEYRTLNQLQKIYNTDSETINQYSSLKVSFMMKTDSTDGNYDINNPPYVESSIVKYNPGLTFRDDYELDYSVIDELDWPEDELANGYWSNVYIQQEASYNSITSDDSNKKSDFGSMNRFKNNFTDTWEKMEYTFNLDNFHNIEGVNENIDNLYFLIQSSGVEGDSGFRGTVLLDNFEVKESYDFIPDVDVRKKKGPEEYGVGDLTKYYDPTIPEQLEAYTDTTAPLEAQFYFYPKYFYNNPIGKEESIIYNDFRRGLFYLYDVDWGDGSPREFTSEPKKLQEDIAIYHTYEKSGIFEIEGTILRLKPNKDLEEIGVMNNKRFTLRINVNEGLDEDFPYFGLGGFSFIPYKNTSPVIGGFSKESIYYKSVKRQLGIISDTTIVNTEFKSDGDRLKTEIALDRMNLSYSDNFELLNAFKEQRTTEADNQGDTVNSGLKTYSEELGKSISNSNITNIRYFNKPKSIVEMLGFGQYSNCDYGMWFHPNDAGETVEAAYEYVLNNWPTAPMMLCQSIIPSNQWRYTVCCPNGVSPGGRECVDNPGGDVTIVPVNNPITGEVFFDTYGEACTIIPTPAGIPDNPRYWKNIIPEDYSIYNREGLVDGQYINTYSEQNWLNDYYYPVLPKYGANGKFIEGDYPNDNIPFPMEGPITDDDYSDENLKISINNEYADLNVFDDNSGNNNYGFVFNDYKPRFNKETLQPEKTKNMSRIKTSTNNGAF